MVTKTNKKLVVKLKQIHGISSTSPFFMTMMRQFNLAFLKTYFGFSNSETAISKCQFITHRESKSVSGE